jgi:hypothetical protein
MLKTSIQTNGRHMIKNPTFIDLEELVDRPQIHRNFQCPEYNDCLTKAAFQDIDLQCLHCPLKNTKRNASITELDIAN